MKLEAARIRSLPVSSFIPPALEVEEEAMKTNTAFTASLRSAGDIGCLLDPLIKYLHQEDLSLNIAPACQSNTNN